MLAATESSESFYEHFQNLLATDLEVDEIEQNLRGELLNMLDSLADQEKALTQIEESVEKAKLDDELFYAFDTWQFLSIDDPDKPGVREVLADLPNAKEIFALLDEVVVNRRSIVSRKEVVDEAILAAWRDKHPSFSSMGIVDSDVQSETLKDLEKLARS